MRTRDDGVRQVSNSEMRTFKECRRRWWLAYHLRYRRSYSEPGAASLGNRVHEALAAFYGQPGQLSYDEAAERMWEVFDRTADQELQLFAEQNFDAKKLTRELKLARAMLEGYVEWLQSEGADSDLEVVGVEQAMEVPSPHPGVNLVAKLDLRVRRLSDGRRLFMDHKTVQDFTTPVKTLHLDEQMLEYHLIERLAQVDEPCAGAIYNMLRKVGRTKSAKPPFYERYPVYHSDKELESFYYRVWGTIRDMLEVEAQLLSGADPRTVAYPTPSRDCTWKCEFFAVCPMFDDGSDTAQVLEVGYEVGDPYTRYGGDLGEETK